MSRQRLPAGSRRRPGPLLLLAALIAGAILLLQLGRSGRDEPIRFTVLAEPRRLPPLEFVDGDGRAANLEQMRGKPVLLNIWATWCPPCRREMAALDRLQGQTGSTGLDVVALSIDMGANGVHAAKSFYAATGIRHLRVYNDARGAAGFDLGAPGVPTTLLLDRQGREIGRISGPAAWDSPEAIALLRQLLESHGG